MVNLISRKIEKLLSLSDSKLDLLPFDYSKNVFKIGVILICAMVAGFVIYQSLFYRWFGYETIPIPMTDEYNYAWQGLSLRQNGVPLGWVTFTHIYKYPKYKTKGGNLDGFGIVSAGSLIDLQKFRQDPTPAVAIEEIDYTKGIEHMFFAVPFFDHPPLGGLIYSLGEGKNVKEVDQVKPAEFRKPALVLAVITAVLLFVFLYLITSNPVVAALGVVVYSTVPTYLLATRTAFLENVVPPFILLQLILLFIAIKYREKFSNKKLVYLFFVLSGLAGGLAYLGKEPAIGFLVGSVVLVVLSKIPRKMFFTFLAAILIPIVCYFLWGIWLQKELFFDVLIANSSRVYFGAIKLVTIFESLPFKNFPIDGWWLWGIISFILISQNFRKYLFLTIPLLSHLLFLLFQGSYNYPWYFISTIPFFAACSAIAIWQIYKNPNLINSLLFFLIAFSSSYYWGRVALNIPPSINHYRWIFLIFLVFLTLRLIYGKFKIVEILWFIFLAYLIYKIIIFNQVFMPYLIAHFGNLPIPSLPNF